MSTQNYMPENYRIFAPDPIETSLAANVDNPQSPSAAPLLGYYQTKGRNDRADYQDQIAAVRDQQAQQFAATNRLEINKNLVTALQHAKDNPGYISALQASGAVDPTVDLSGYDAAVNKQAEVANTEKVLNGAGRSAQGGINVQAVLDKLLGTGTTTQGVNPQIGAAQLTADGRRDAAAIGANGRGGISAILDPVDGGVKYTGKLLPGETQEGFKLRAGGGVPVTSLRQQVTNKADASARGVPQNLPVAQTDSGGAMPPPAPVAAAPTVVPGRTNADVARDLVTKNLATLQQKNPQVYADVLAGAGKNGGKLNIVAQGNRWAVVGGSGQSYPLGAQ